MEKKMKVKQHKKHGHKLHRSLDPYQLYELEHMPKMLVKLPSHGHDHDHDHEAYRHNYSEVDPPGGHGERIFRPDYPEVGPPGGHNERIFRPDYYETGRTWEPDIDAKAEKFIRMEHKRFAPNKWM